MLVIRPERVNKNENFMNVCENISLTDVISPALELISGLMKRSLWRKCMWLVRLQNRTCNRSQIFCFGWSGPVLNSRIFWNTLLVLHPGNQLTPPVLEDLRFHKPELKSQESVDHLLTPGIFQKRLYIYVFFFEWCLCEQEGDDSFDPAVNKVLPVPLSDFDGGILWSAAGLLPSLTMTIHSPSSTPTESAGKKIAALLAEVKPLSSFNRRLFIYNRLHWAMNKFHQTVDGLQVQPFYHFHVAVVYKVAATCTGPY